MIEMNTFMVKIAISDYCFSGWLVSSVASNLTQKQKWKREVVICRYMRIRKVCEGGHSFFTIMVPLLLGNEGPAGDYEDKGSPIQRLGPIIIENVDRCQLA
jgi:hypothetical protein